MKAVDAMDKYFVRQRALDKVSHPLAYSLDKPLKSVCCTFKISILPKVLWRLEVYFFTLLHIIFFLLKQQGYTIFMVAEGPSDPWGFPLKFSAISIPSGLMSLLLVFFNGQCYTRYVNLYQACTAMGGSVQELAQLSATHAMATPDVRWDAARFLLASVMMVYMKVTDIAANRSPCIDPEDWDRLTQTEDEWLSGSPMGGAAKGAGASKAPPILLPHEVATLKQCKGNESQVLQIWCLDAMWKVPKKPAPALKMRTTARRPRPLPPHALPNYWFASVPSCAAGLQVLRRTAQLLPVRTR